MRTATACVPVQGWGMGRVPVARRKSVFLYGYKHIFQMERLLLPRRLSVAVATSLTRKLGSAAAGMQNASLQRSAVLRAKTLGARAPCSKSRSFRSYFLHLPHLLPLLNQAGVVGFLLFNARRSALSRSRGDASCLQALLLLFRKELGICFARGEHLHNIAIFTEFN